MSTTIKTIMHVAPVTGNVYGIRIRIAHNAPGVWLGQGWEDQCPVGALPGGGEGGWRWARRQDAEEYLREIKADNKQFASKEMP